MKKDNRIAFAGLFENECSRLFSCPSPLSKTERLLALASYEVLLRRALHFPDTRLTLSRPDNPCSVFADTAPLAGLGPDQAARTMGFLQDAGLIEHDRQAGQITFPLAALHGSIVLPAALRNRRYRRRVKEKRLSGAMEAQS